MFFDMLEAKKIYRPKKNRPRPCFFLTNGARAALRKEFFYSSVLRQPCMSRWGYKTVKN
jgi:hypothetical protein